MNGEPFGAPHTRTEDVTRLYSPDAWRASDDKHVLMVSAPCCTRVIKQATALRAKGWRVDSLSLVPGPADAFDVAMTAQSTSFHQHIAESGAKYIHVHNEPDGIMHHADAGARGRPVVYDCHDLEYHRYSVVTDDERYAFGRADGIINVGESYRDFAYSLHPWTVPEAIVHSLPIRSAIPEPPATRSTDVVYQGGVVPPGNKMSWRDMRVPVETFAAAGVPFDLYTDPRMSEFYPRVKGVLPYRDMLKAISGYTWGFVGVDPTHEKFDKAYPNKLMEYAACGVIPLIVNARSAAAYFGSGIVATSTAEAIDKMRFADVDALRADVLAHARFMDDEIDKTIALYEELS